MTKKELQKANEALEREVQASNRSLSEAWERVGQFRLTLEAKSLHIENLESILSDGQLSRRHLGGSGVTTAGGGGSIYISSGGGGGAS